MNGHEITRTRWTIKSTQRGHSLYWDGELVCSADSPMDLLAYAALMNADQS